MRKVQVTKYVSCDGCEFDTEEDCILHDSNEFNKWLKEDMLDPEDFFDKTPDQYRVGVLHLLKTYWSEHVSGA